MRFNLFHAGLPTGLLLLSSSETLFSTQVQALRLESTNQIIGSKHISDETGYEPNQLAQESNLSQLANELEDLGESWATYDEDSLAFTQASRI